MLRPMISREGATLMAAASRQGLKMTHDEALTILKYMAGYDGMLMVSDDLKLHLHKYTDGNDNSKDLKVDVLALVKMALQICKDLMDWTDNTKESDWLVAMREFSHDKKVLDATSSRMWLAQGA